VLLRVAVPVVEIGQVLVVVLHGPVAVLMRVPYLGGQPRVLVIVMPPRMYRTMEAPLAGQPGRH